MGIYGEMFGIYWGRSFSKALYSFSKYLLSTYDLEHTRVYVYVCVFVYPWSTHSLLSEA